MNFGQKENIQREEQATPEVEKQATIFEDLTDFSEYEKTLKRARSYLYIITGIQIVVGTIQFFSMRDSLGTEYALLNAGIIAGIGLVFLVLALWSYKKPAAAFLTALIFFVVVHAADAIADISQLWKGILLKVLVLAALIKGLKDAREYEEMKRTLTDEGAVEFR